MLNDERKMVMVLTVTHPFDSVEVLGIFDDKEILRKQCFFIIEKDTYLYKNIQNLHIFKCPLNKMIGEFYPVDCDNTDILGMFLENQDDISEEILGENFG